MSSCHRPPRAPHASPGAPLTPACCPPALGALLALALAACGGGGEDTGGSDAGEPPGCRDGACSGSPDGGGAAGDRGSNGAAQDGGPAQGDGAALQPPEQLEARLQVNGANAPCGSCAVLVAQAAGGEPPYTYEWSDDSLEGPGPHSVCPEEPTEYTVTVRDDSAIETGEFQQEAMVAEARGEVACVDDAEAWGGCVSTGEAAQSQDGSEPPAQQECAWKEIDPATAALLGIEETRQATAFSSPTLPGQGGLVPGRTYEISYDQLLLQLNLGKPVQVEIWGAAEPCGQDQLYGTLMLDGRWHQSICFEAEEAWPYTRIDIDTGDVVFYLEFVPSATTVCKGCSEE